MVLSLWKFTAAEKVEKHRKDVEIVDGWTVKFLRVSADVGDEVAAVVEPRFEDAFEVLSTRDKETSPTEEYFSKNCVSDMLRRSFSVWSKHGRRRDATNGCCS